MVLMLVFEPVQMKCQLQHSSGAVSLSRWSGPQQWWGSCSTILPL